MKTTSESKKDYYFAYTVLFCLMTLAVYLPFTLNGKGFLWNPDGPDLHWTSLAYYGEYLRSLLKNIASGNFSLPEYDFSIGYGSPIISTLHWDVLGDPLNLLSIFFAPQDTEKLLRGLMILRLYLAGLAFSAYCMKTGRDKVGTLAGTFSYIFCGYSIYASVRHPHFLNPMILFPLLLLAVDRLMFEKKRGLFAFLVFLSLVTSFYFSYMLAIFVVIYFFARFFSRRGGSIKAFFGLFSLFISGLTGVMMSCAILLPVVLLFRGGLRVNTRILYPPAYSLDYYEKMITDLLTAQSFRNWTVLGVSVSAFIAALALFGRRASDQPETARQTRTLKIALAGSFLLLLIPFAGSALNGFNYVSNRWEWMFAAVISYTLAAVWPDLFSMTKRQKGFVYGGSAVYICLLFILTRGVYRITFAASTLLMAALLILYVFEKEKSRRVRRLIPGALVCLTLVHICVNASYNYGADKGRYVEEFADRDSMYSLYTSGPSQAAGSAVSDKGDRGKIVRYEQDQYDENLLNTDLLARTNSTQFYWSLANGNISQYLLDMGLSSFNSYFYYGLGRRTFLDTLAGVKYFTAGKGRGAALPYGFGSETSYTVGLDQEKYKVYTNKYALPLGYSYSSYIGRDQYDEMDPAQRQEALMQGALLEEDGALAAGKKGVGRTDVSYTSQTIPYQVECGSGVRQVSEGEFLVGKAGGAVSLQFEGRPGCETGLLIKGLSAVRMTAKQLYTDGNEDLMPYKDYRDMSPLYRNDINREDRFASSWDEEASQFDIQTYCGDDQALITYRNPFNLYYIGQKDFLAEYGYSKEARKSITIVFPTAGRYTFDKMSVVCQPMDSYPAQAKALRDQVLEGEKHEGDTVSGRVDLDRTRILLLTIPYDSGWTAYVDGKQTPVYRANVMNSALILDKGKHRIKLVYRTPGLREGVKISLAGCGIFLLILIVQGIGRSRRQRRL